MYRLHPPPEPSSGPDQDDLINAAEYLLDGDNEGDHGGEWTSLCKCLNDTPGPEVHRVEVGRVGRPLVLGDEMI